MQMNRGPKGRVDLRTKYPFADSTGTVESVFNEDLRQTNKQRKNPASLAVLKRQQQRAKADRQKLHDLEEELQKIQQEKSKTDSISSHSAKITPTSSWKREITKENKHRRSKEEAQGPGTFSKTENVVSAIERLINDPFIKLFLPQEYLSEEVNTKESDLRSEHESLVETDCLSSKAEKGVSNIAIDEDFESSSEMTEESTESNWLGLRRVS